MSTQTMKCSGCAAMVMAGPHDNCPKCGGILLPPPPPKAVVIEPEEPLPAHTAESMKFFRLSLLWFSISPIGVGIALFLDIPALAAVSLAGSLFIVIIGCACLICSVVADDHRRT